LVMWLGLPLFAMHLMLNTFVGGLFQIMLSGYYSDAATVTFREPYYTWTGDIGLRDLSVAPLEGSDLAPLTVKDVRIDMPSWGVLMQVAGALDSEEAGSDEHVDQSMAFIDKIDHVGIHFQGLKTEFDDGLPDALSYFGLSSAAPFEAEGCAKNVYWDAGDVSNMGIADNGVDLNFSLSTRTDDGLVVLKGAMNAPSASKVDFEQHYKVARLSSFMDSEGKQHIPSYQLIEVHDAGFIKARNAFCAKRDGVTPEEFVERHIQSIQRLLLMQGFHADVSLEGIYRAYLKNGYLKVEAKPNGSIRMEDYKDYAPADQFKLFNATIASNGAKPAPLQMEVLPAKAIPYSFQGSTWDWVAEETANPEAGLDNQSGTRRVSLSGRGSLFDPAAPASVVQAAVTEAEIAVVDEKTIAFSDAGKHIGDRVVVITVYGDKRRGDIETANGKDIGLRVYVGQGYAIQHIERSYIRSIEKVQ
ncbi:MAG: hypothetical protein ACREO2_03705, partial [Arenimonas sp.]